MTFPEALEALLTREGENKANGYVTPGDRGGRTSWGISERAYPSEWKNGPPTRERAAQLYAAIYLHIQEWCGSEVLSFQVWDFAVNSGMTRAVYVLQEALGIKEPTGHVGPLTREHLAHTKFDPDSARMINNAYVAFRLRFIDALTDHELSQKKFEEGWENRALSFLLT